MNHSSLHRIIVVDSTRRGKRYPDALSKTIPLWCAVINTSIKEVYMLEQWDNALYTSPIAVSRSEHDQMAAKVDAYAQALVVCLPSFGVVPISFR